MKQRPEEGIGQRTHDVVQELQKEVRAATQRQIDTMVAFLAKLEAQTINDPELVGFHPKTVAVASQYPPRGTEAPEVNPTDVGSVAQSQAPEQDAQGITTNQGPGEKSQEPLGRGKIEEVTDKDIAPKRLRRRRQAALVFLRVSKPLRSWSR
ncbi:hypothetical protein PG985_005598 [Apiospora marii]|uniref:uncharacterized protein n=1 Tax=Apiospora marii TaxID=335849 RepID=UPI0031305EE1